jgi:hypothetical protein
MIKNLFTLKNLGWLLTAVVVYMLGMAGVSKVTGSEEMIQVFTLFNLQDYMMWVGVAEIVSVLLLIYPKTSMFGALAITSIMSAAIGQHLSCLAGSGVVAPTVIAVLAWSAHCLRRYC